VPDLGQFLVVALIGIGTGVLSGMFGVGGAIVSTPAIRATGASPLDAVGSTLPSIIPSAISGTIRYARAGLVRGDVFLWTSSTGIAAAIGGALVTSVVPGDGHPLMLLTAGLLGVTAVRLGRPRPAVETIGDRSDLLFDVGTEPERTSAWRPAVIGIAAGLLSGLLGIGGGLVLVPAFTGWLRIPLKAALGTSLACVGVLAVPSMATHAVLGNIDWSYAIPLSAGVIPGAQIGSYLAIRSTERTLRVAVAAVLGTTALVYFVGELLSLLA
jgi:uncharacterized membrane protein YfcA